MLTLAQALLLSYQTADAGTDASADAAGDGVLKAGSGQEPEEEIPGQLVELKFRAPRAGKYDLTLYCVSGTCPPHT